MLTLHAAANLFNTYYDFLSGADVIDHSDDRALVDGKVAQRTIMRSAVMFLVVGLGCGMMLAVRGARSWRR